MVLTATVVYWWHGTERYSVVLVAWYSEVQCCTGGMVLRGTVVYWWHGTERYSAVLVAWY